MKFLTRIKMRTKLMLLLIPPTLCFLIYGVLFISNIIEDSYRISWNKNLDKILLPFEELYEASVDEQGSSFQTRLGFGKSEHQEARIHLDKVINTFTKQTSQYLVDQFSSILPIRGRILALLEKLPIIREQIDTHQISPSNINTYFDEINSLALRAIDDLSLSYQTQEQFLKPHTAYLFLLKESAFFQQKRFFIEQALTNNTISPEDLVQLSQIVEGEKLSSANFNSFATPYQQTTYQELMSSPSVAQASEVTKTILDKNIAGNYGVKLDTYVKASKHKDALFNQALKKLQTQLNEQTDSIEKRNFISLVVTGIILVVVLLVIIFLGWKIVADILGVLKELSNSALQIVQKDLTQISSQRTRSDEFGLLENSYDSVRTSIQEIVRSLNLEIKHISKSSSQIVSAIAELATGQQETEHAVIEMNSTMEELRQSSELANNKASEVVEFAQDTFNILKTSTDAIHATVDDLNQIQEKMGIISESTTRLNDHCQAIGIIIDSVHDLAEQSHVLAVNASIEAAKAGEQGKSFAVVAQEVRNLAEQSQAATKQVHNILTDIQNSMNTAVLATEQGSTAVSKGVEQSSNTTESIEYLSTSVEKMIHSAEDISETSAQQLIAVTQTTEAMGNIKKATSEHKEQSTKIENNITDLHVISEKLSYLIGEFKLPKSTHDELKDGE